MQITYSLEPEDLWRYNKFLINKVAYYKFRFLLRLVSVPIGTLLTGLILQWILWWCIVFTVGITCAWVPFCYWSLRRHYLKGINQQPGLLGLHTLEISAEGLKQQTSISDSVLKWSSFSEIVENPDQVLLFITQKFAVVIPKRAFQSPQQAQHFLQTARAYWKGNPAPNEAGHDAAVWPPPPRLGN